jgi:hypothetical protein
MHSIHQFAASHAVSTASRAWPVELFADLPSTADAELPVASPRPHPAEDLGMGALLRFKSMMAMDGQNVHVARMCYDRHYAYERIASAHASARDPLRRLALELFQAYLRRDEAHAISG